MNNIIVLISIIIFGMFVYAGLALDTQVNGLSRQNRELGIQNNHLDVEILKKQTLTQEPPVEISKAFSLVINEIRYLEEYSGTSMKLIIANSHNNEGIANHYVDSQYRGIKKLPVLIQVDKFSDETDMGAVLNDIYQLEADTDFKATEINKEGNTLIVKGDVYGF